MSINLLDYSGNTCICSDVEEINGAHINPYCSNHLKIELVDGEKWQIIYKCPETGIQWLKDFPSSEYHGGGVPRLRRLPLSEETDE
jgi:Immunity protein 27